MTAAARCLAAGGLVAFPTETVYGLGADAANGEAVARLYEAKGRPAFNPLISHVPDIDAARHLGAFRSGGGAAGRCLLAGAADPGAAAHGRLSGRRACDRGARHHCRAGSRSCGGARSPGGLRPAGGRAIGEPLRPSVADDCTACAGRSARARRPDRRRRRDAGRCRIRRSSPASASPLLLRPGGVPRAEIERVLGQTLVESPAPTSDEGEAPLAPGQLASHYAPAAALRLDAHDVNAGEALLAFGAPLPAGAEQRRASSTCRAAAISSRRRPTCSRICARSMPPARSPSP